MANSDHDPKNNKVTRRGLLLKETREVKGLSIETVHEMTKIPLDVLHAIEEGYTVRMVSAYYFKGFIKMYAKFLGLDASLVLDEPMPEKPVSDPDAPVSVVADPEHRKFNEYIVRQNKKQTTVGLVLLGISVVVLAIAFGIWKHHSNSEPRVPQPPKVKKESPTRKMLEAQSADRKMVEQSKTKTKTEPKPEKKEVVRAVAPAPVEASPAEDVQDTPQPTETAKSTNGKKVTLSIKSRSAGWLQVKTDGNVVFQSTLRAGAVESWSADKSIEVSGKNINNLEFEVNGKTLGQLGKSDRGARRVVVTKDGLTVKN